MKQKRTPKGAANTKQITVSRSKRKRITTKKRMETMTRKLNTCKRAKMATRIKKVTKRDSGSQNKVEATAVLMERVTSTKDVILGQHGNRKNSTPAKKEDSGACSCRKL